MLVIRARANRLVILHKKLQITEDKLQNMISSPLFLHNSNTHQISKLLGLKRGIKQSNK